MIFEPYVWDARDYVEEVTSNRPYYNDLKNMEKDFKDRGINLWNYPLNEVEHILDENVFCVLVRFGDEYVGYEYRWCELPWHK